MNNLKKLREEKAISQIQFIEEIAKPPYKLNVSRRTLQYWESGERDIKIDKAKILAKYFDVSVPYLLGFYTVIKPDEKKRKEFLEKRNKRREKQREKLNKEPFLVIDYSNLIDFKYNEDGLNDTKLETLENYNKLDSEYKKILFINAIDLLEKSKENDILKMSKNIFSIQEAEKLDRKMWIEELELNKNNDSNEDL